MAIHPFAHDTVAPAWSAAGRPFRGPARAPAL